MCGTQELAKAARAKDQFGFKLDVKEAMLVAAQAATTVSEAFLISLIMDEEVAIPVKKKKIEREIAQYASQSEAFGHDVQGMVHPRIISESTGLLLQSK